MPTMAGSHRLPGGRRREEYPESRALPEPAFNIDPATMRLGDMFDQRQPESRPCDGAGRS